MKKILKKQSGLLTAMVLAGLFTGLFSVTARAQSQGLVPDAVELQALQDFYTSTNGPTAWGTKTNWTNLSTITTVTGMNLYGVSVTNGDVTGIDFGTHGNNLSGPLPASIGNLTQLKKLLLSEDNITGSLPATIGQLTELTYLEISVAKLSGPIPAEIGQLTKLTYLNLLQNLLTGEIPGAIGNMASLTYLNLNTNKLSGKLPVVLGNLANLTYLNLENNAFIGEVPAEIGKLRQLASLYLAENQLTKLPKEIGRLTNLVNLTLSLNKLPALPDSLSRLSKLALLEAYGNTINGKATFVAGLPNLVTLKLYANRLSGEVPSLNGLTKLVLLDVRTNNFTALPDFSQHPNKGSLSVYATANNLDFTNLLVNKNAGLLAFTYTPQVLPVNSRPNFADTIEYVKGTAVTMRVQDNHPDNAYQWEKVVNGVGVLLDGETNREYTLPNADESAAGIYRCKVSNSQFAGLAHYSHNVLAVMDPFPKQAMNLPVMKAIVQVPQFKPVPAAGTVPEADLNYVRTWTARSAVQNLADMVAWPTDSVQLSTAYFDGLGRPAQTVVRQESAGRRDVVTPVAYDAYGRAPKSFLPYVNDTVAATGPGGYRPDAEREQYRFYRFSNPYNNGVPKTDAPYSEQLFEPSPLNRVVAEGQPGESWRLTSNHETLFNELVNTAADSVPTWSLGGTVDLPTISFAGWQQAGQLFVKQTTDEHGSRSREFTDKEGRLVCKAVEQDSTHWLRTWYVYNALGQLSYVAPPRAAQLLLANGAALLLAQVNGAATTAVLAPAAALVYRYFYDARGRVIVKQVPGAGEVYLVYDKLDRVVASQDGRQRALATKQWSFTKYDALGRQALTGYWNYSSTRSALQTAANGYAALFESRSTDATTQYYTNTAFPVSGSAQILTVNYYDNYNFDNDGQGTADVSFDGQDLPFGAEPFLRVRGQLTGTKTLVLGSTPAAYLQTVTFYDDKGRVLQTQSQNQLGGTDVTTTRYNFSGQALATHSVHRKTGQTDLITKQLFTYDHAGRLLQTKQQLNQEPVETLALNAYNETGQLQSKVLGTKLQQVDYGYNIRGWLVNINDANRTNPKDLFGLELYYDKGFDYLNYNGNISGVKWQSASDYTVRAYGYRYDPLNRLTQADYRAYNAAMMDWSGEQENNKGHFDAYGMGYDAGGNLLQLKRRGYVRTDGKEKQYGEIDRLTYTYTANSNQLKIVDDWYATANNPADFEDNGSQNGTAAEYTYDQNGNLTKDANKGITAIAYNYLNLPEKLTFGTKGTMEFLYTASGEKLKKTVTEKATGQPDKVTVTNYVNGLVYRNDTLQFMPTSEGRAVYQPAALTNKWAYEYHYKDHLGNLRLAFRQQPAEVKAASMEASAGQQEEQDFDNVAQTRFTGIARTGTDAARLNAAQGKPLGPMRQFAVQRDDSISLTAFANYPQPANPPSLWNLLSFVSSWFTATPQTGSEYYAGTNKFTPYLSLGLAASMAAVQPDADAPTAYLKYIVYDADSNYVTSGLRMVSSLAKNLNWEELNLNYKVEQDGFVQVFVSNDSNVDAFFDDIAVSKIPALIVQENHYDPWGQDLVGINKEDKKSDKRQYNGIEKQEEFGLNVDMAKYRTLDKQLGRWWQIDPKVEGFENLTPYNSNLNNPVRYSDPKGDCPTCPPGMESNPLSYMAVGFSQYFQAIGSAIDKAGAKAEAFFSFGGEKEGTLGAVKGNVSNETRTTISVGTTAKDFFTPTSNNKPMVASPLKASVKTTNETKATVSGKVAVEGVDIHTKNVTSKDNSTGKVNNTTTVTVGKDQTGVFVETGTKGTKAGVRTEQKVSAPNGAFIKFGGSISVGN